MISQKDLSTGVGTVTIL